MVARLTLCLCLCSLTAHFMTDGLGQPALAREACACVSQPEAREAAETCDPHSSYVLPRPALASPQLSLHLALAAPGWRACSQPISPTLPPPKTQSA
jgi:hypothetical protein